MPIIDRANWETLEPLLDEAMDLSPEERSQWLEQLSGRSPVLAAELAAFLAEEAIADRRGFLAGMPDVSLEGLELGAYRLERPLGQGGMGTVWLARRTDGRFEGVAALKLLNLAMVNPTAQERFRREGSVLARLTHPGIARLLDAGVTSTGQPFLVLEHVDGVPIDEFIEQRRLTRPERIQLFLQVLDAVGHAHTNLIVHRDLKPSNILVTSDGTVKLLDFGIAKLLDDDSSGERTALTVEGGRVFTPHYAAPEQVRGETLTTATDVYALGVLLYVLISGRHPTAEKSRTPAETVQALLEREPVKLGAGDLDTILAKALRKPAGERYQTVAAFADDLQRYLRQEPVSARPSSLSYRIGKFIRRNTAAAVGSAALLAILVGATLFSLGQARKATRERDLALLQTERADALLVFQRALLSQVGDRSMTLSQILNEGMALVANRHTGQPKLESDVMTGFAGMYWDLGQRDQSRSLYARAESLAAATGDRPLLVKAQCRIARIMSEMNLQDSIASKLVLFHQIPLSDLDVEDQALCLAAQGEDELSRDQIDSSIITFQRAKAILDRNHRTRSQAYIAVVGQLGVDYVNTGQMREAIAALHRVRAVVDTLGMIGTVSGITTHSQLVLPLLVIGELVEADSVTIEMMQLLESSPIGPQRTIAYLTNRAAVTQYLGWPDSAAKYFSRLVEMGEQSGSRSMTRRFLFGLGRAQVQQGQTAQARRSLEKLRGMRDSTGTASREETHLVAWIDAAEGNLAAADSAFTSVLTRDGYFKGSTDNPGTRQVLLAASDVALRLGDAPRALKLAQDARKAATVDSLTDTRSGYVGEARLLEARAELAEGDTAKARTTLKQALPALRFGYGAGNSKSNAAEVLLTRLGS